MLQGWFALQAWLHDAALTAASCQSTGLSAVELRVLTQLSRTCWRYLPGLLRALPAQLGRPAQHFS